MPILSGIGPNTSASNAQVAGTGLADNFDTFLTLLTEQLKNQDPLSPLDSTEFVGQLVQFSGVEQQINQNRNLESLLGLNAASSAVGFIGKSVDVLGNSSELVNGSARWTYSTDPDAKDVTILVKDISGKIVFETQGEAGASEQNFVWDGRDNLGNLLADGSYNLEVSALDTNGNLLPTSVFTSFQITGADFSGQEPLLFAGQTKISFADIIAVREAPFLI